MESTVQRFPVSRFVFNGYNARQFQPDQSFIELVESVRMHGVIQPIVARMIGDEGKFEVVAGERRLRACLHIAEADGREVEIPADIRDLTDDEAWNLMMAENLVRADLSPHEEAQSYKRHLDRYGDNPESINELSQRTGYPAARIRSRLALLTLPQPVVDAWSRGEISTTHVDELTRIEDEKTVLTAFTAIIKDKLTVAELRETLRAQAPELSCGYFDKTECGVCPSNSSLQCSLFEADNKGKCLNPVCFEQKQADFFTTNWSKSKVRAAYKTNGFKFQHNLTAAQRTAIQTDKVAERCLECPEYVSLMKLVGRTVDGFERCCAGSKDCYTELYVPKKAEQKKAEPAKTGKTGITKGKGADTANKQSGKPAATDNIMDAKRATTHREEFYKTAMPNAIGALDLKSPAAMRLAIAAMAVADFSAREALGGKNSSIKDYVPRATAELSDDDLPGVLLRMAQGVIMKSTGSSAEIRDSVAAMLLGIDVAKEWSLTESYLKALTKTEIVKAGEDLGLWVLPEIKARKDKLFPKKGLMSLKNGELIDLLLKSGADLTGRTPKEIVEAGRRVEK